MKRKSAILGSWLGGALLMALSISVLSAARADAAENIGAAACVACHSEQGEAFKKTIHGRKLPIVKKVDFEQSCEKCHGPGSDHAGAAGDRSNAGFATTAVKPELCLNCHKGTETMLWDVSDHAQAGLTCGKCHSAHKGQGRKQLILSETETCLQCHKKNRLKMGLPSHHPMKEGKMSCGSCHNPHGGESGNLRAASTEELCFKCHAEKAGPFVHEHPPVVEDCAICHDPHGSQNDKLLVQRQPFLCLKCHKWPHQEATVGKAAYYRPKKLYERARCTICHNDIHGSDFKASLKR